MQRKIRVSCRALTQHPSSKVSVERSISPSECKRKIDSPGKRTLDYTLRRHTADLTPEQASTNCSVEDSFFFFGIVSSNRNKRSRD